MRCRFRAAIRESNILQTESSQALIVVGGRLPPIDAPSARYEALHIGGGSTDRAPPCARHAHLPDFRAKKSFSTCGPGLRASSTPDECKLDESEVGWLRA